MTPVLRGGTGRFDGRTVLVTGAAGRLGTAIAERFAAEGAALCLVDARQDGLARLAHGLAGGDGATPFAWTADLADPAQAAAAVAAAFEVTGGIDVLVNCAGRYQTGRFVESSPEGWLESFDVNLGTVLNTVRAVSRRWTAAGCGGAVVNLSSAASLHPRAGTAAYATAKTALNGLTTLLAMELGPSGIRVNAVAPGMVLDRVHSRETIGAADDEIRLVLESTPLGRTGRPADVAAAVAFLASEEAAWITGVILPVTGGAHFGRAHYPIA